MDITLNRTEALDMFKAVCPNNRTINIKKLVTYAHEMNDGNWEVGVGSSLEVLGGHLKNGQHRLISFLMSEKEQITLPISLELIVV